MATIEHVHAPTLGQAGEACRTCGNPLAEDQRYCLNCGTRRAEARVPFLETVRGPAGRERTVEETVDAPVLPPREERPITPLGAGIGLGLLVLALGVGVLIGTSGDDQPVQQTAAAPPVVAAAPEDAQAATENASTSTGGGEQAGGPFKSDWPKGKKGWTVSLQTFDKKGTQVAALNKAKADAKGKGAKDAGVLDSDEYGTLAAGQYVLFNGVFDSQAEASKALASVKKGFPKAEVVEVGPTPKANDDDLFKNKDEAVISDEGLKNLENIKDPDAYQKEARKLPKVIVTPGAPPKKEKKIPGSALPGEI